MNRATKVAVITVLAAAAAGALAVLVVRGQIKRHRRDLFSQLVSVGQDLVGAVTVEKSV